MKDGNLPLKASEKTTLKHKRRYCKVDGCSRIVKSQGVCQRHGAKPRKCRVVDCPKQAQGNYDGMCKAHFRAHKNNELVIKEEPTKAQRTPAMYCQPVVISQDSSVTEESSRQGPEGEDSIATTFSSGTEEDSTGRELWDEPYFCANGTRSEELAADLFGVLADPSSMTPEEWSSTVRKEEGSMPIMTHRSTFSCSSIPSCSDYTPNYYASNYYHHHGAYEHRDANNNYMSSSSYPYMDYYIHENANAREAV